MSEAVTLAALMARLEALEAQAAIRAVMADYLHLCDHLDADTPMDRLGAIFTRDAVWAGAGARYRAAFGSHHGRAAILAMLDRFRQPPHFTFNAHFLSGERIDVDGARAHGTWMMLQTSTYSSGGSDLRSARLEIDFAHEEGCWRIHHFRTENLFSRSVDRWDDAAGDVGSLT